MVAGVAFAALGPAIGLIHSVAQADPPPRTAEQLLVDVAQSDTSALSGTVQATANLGLPALPEVVAPSGPGSAADPLALLSGTHTLRVWANGPDKGRVALLSTYGESDLIRNGADVWAWTSSNREATHWTLPADGTAGAPGASGPSAPSGSPSMVPMTPQQAADQALANLDPTTVVTADKTTTVAGRSAYVLELQPRSATTLVDSVQIAIDSATHVPTQVQIYAKGQGKAALSVGFTQFDPSAPSDSVFDFAPGPGVTVKQGELPTAGSPSQDAGAKPDVSVVGTGWDTVLVATLPPGSTAPAPGQPDQGSAGALLKALPQVSGSWGSGRLLKGSLFSVVLTDDGRVAIGAVPPDQLYAALG